MLTSSSFSLLVSVTLLVPKPFLFFEEPVDPQTTAGEAISPEPPQDSSVPETPQDPTAAEPVSPPDSQEDVAPVPEAPSSQQPAQQGTGAESLVREQDESTKATAQVEGEQLTERDDVPRTLRPLQSAGFWTLVGSLTAVGIGGLLGGFAEREEDKALRIAARFDSQKGRQPYYSEVKNDYEQIITRGERLQWASRSFLILGGAAFITSVVLLAVDSRRASRVQASAGGFSVRF